MKKTLLGGHFRSAVRAAAGFFADGRLAIWTITRGHFSRLFFLFGQFCERADEQKNDNGYDQEIDDIVDEYPVIKGWSPSCLGVCQAGVFLSVQTHKQVRKIYFSQ